MEERANGGVRLTCRVLGAPIDVLGWDTALERISGWAVRNESKVICICNAHSVVTANQDPAFLKVLADADMATADGAPVAFMVRRSGFPRQERINGPDLMWRCCSRASGSGESIYLYGGSPETLALLQARLALNFPELQIAGAYSPPYRQLSIEEDRAVVTEINASGAGIVWVGLGCPKQEQWMAAHRGRVNSVMIGVGAAFDYHAGTLKRAPVWMQQSGLEWFYRLGSEPRRLWRRYLVTNSLFIWYAIRQLVRIERISPKEQ